MSPKTNYWPFDYRAICRSSRLSFTIKNLNEFPRSTRRAYFFLFLMPFAMVLLLNEYSFGAKSFRDNRLRFILGWQWIMDLRFVCENGVGFVGNFPKKWLIGEVITYDYSYSKREEKSKYWYMSFIPDWYMSFIPENKRMSLLKKSQWFSTQMIFYSVE